MPEQFLSWLTTPTALTQLIESAEVTELLEKMRNDYQGDEG